MSYVSSTSSDVLAYEPITTSGSVSFSGLGNGTDFGTIIDATVEAEEYEKEALEAQVEEVEYTRDLLDQLNDELASLSLALQDLDEPDEFIAMTTSSTGDEVGVSASGEAKTGSHTVVVNQLAQNDVWVNESLSFSESTEEIASSDTTMSFTYGGESITIEVPAHTTAQGLVDIINSDSGCKDKVEANLLYDGNGYHLALTGAESGKGNVIQITATGTLTGFDPADFVNTQAAQSAEIKVDGYPSGSDTWMERDTNTADDVIDGLTLELNDVTSESGIKVSVGYDEDAIKENIYSMVESVNQIIYDIQVVTGRVTTYVEDSDGNEVESYTVDNYALDIIYNDIKSSMASQALGFQSYDEENGEGDWYSVLSQVGLYTDTTVGSTTYGQILIDEDELDEALAEDPYGVAMLFSANGQAESDNPGVQVLSTIDGLTGAGEHEVKYEVSGGAITSATIDGVSVTIDGNTLLAGSGCNANGLHLEITDLSDGSHSATVSVKQGKCAELSDAITSMTDPETGTLPIMIDNYKTTLTSLENQIYNEEKRLDTLRTELTRKYAVLDSLLATYSTLSDQLATQLESLSG